MLVEPGFEDVAVLARNQIEAARGGALAVYLDGRPVMDVWHGPKDPATGAVWQADTMAMSFSVSKGIVSAAVHLLIERGQVDVDAPVASYWPEFAANGKQSLTIRQLLSMEAGLYDVRHLVERPRDLLDWDRMVALLAAARPLHEPGTANAYHAFTYGWLVGEIVRRVTGDTIGAFVDRELTDPLGLDGCHIGVPAERLHRVAARPDAPPENWLVRGLAKAADPLTRLAGFSPRRVAAAFLPRESNEVITSDEFLAAEVPSINGVYTARSLARLYAALGSDDGLDGVHLWSPETRRRATQQQNNRRDLVLPVRMRWQLGFAQPFPRTAVSENAFGFYGAFGSGAYADPTRGLAVGFVCRQARFMPMLKLVPAIVAATETTTSGAPGNGKEPEQ